MRAPSRRAAPVVLLLLLTLAWPAALVPAGPAGAAEVLASVVRVAGGSRFETAIALSRRAFDAANAAVLVFGDDPVAAAIAAPLAAVGGGPVLLTAEDHLPAEVAAEIRRLGASEVTLVAPVADVHPQLRDEVSALGVELHVVSDPDLPQLAIAVADRMPPADQVLLAPIGVPDIWPQVLVAGTIGAALEAPVLLTLAGGVLPAVNEVLVDRDPALVLAIGDSRVLSGEVTRQVGRLGLAAGRVTGVDVEALSVAAADHVADLRRCAPGPPLIGSGGAFPDLLAAPAAAAATCSPLLLVDPIHPAPVPADGRVAGGGAVTAALDAAVEPVDLVLLGGAASIRPSVAERLGGAALATPLQRKALPDVRSSGGDVLALLLGVVLLVGVGRRRDDPRGIDDEAPSALPPRPLRAIEAVTGLSHRPPSDVVDEGEEDSSQRDPARC